MVTPPCTPPEEPAMRTPRLIVSMLGCALALSLAACSQQTTASLYPVHDDPALRAHTQATAQTTSKDPTVGQLWSSFQTSLAAAKTMRIAGTCLLYTSPSPR